MTRTYVTSMSCTKYVLHGVRTHQMYAVLLR